MKPRAEKVLCLSREQLPQHWLGPMSSVAVTGAEFYRQTAGSVVYWLDRDVAEKEPAFKQLIPYLVIQSANGSLTACYRRSGSEKRLHRLCSVGIGGHINPEDKPDAAEELERIVYHGLAREIAEETGLTPSGISPEVVGVINEDVTPVGRVHLGLVHVLSVEHPELVVPSPELSGFSWVETEKAADLNLEYWSRLALNLVLR